MSHVEEAGDAILTGTAGAKSSRSRETARAVPRPSQLPSQFRSVRGRSEQGPARESAAQRLFRTQMNDLSSTYGSEG